MIHPLFRIAFALFAVFFLTSSRPQPKDLVAAFLPGEEISYRVHYGFINAGEAFMRLTDKYYLVNQKVCYRAEIVGNTTGAFDRVVRIRDVWGSYFDSVEFKPQKSFRSIRENKYRRREETYYDYTRNIARLTAENDTPEVFTILPEIQDMVSGYYYLRMQEYQKLKAQDTIRINGVFEDKTYRFKIVYLGKETIKTKLGKANAFVISPIMPENSLFKGKNPIKMWISDDPNHIPLKVEAELLLGSLDLDITGYKNLKYPIRFQ